MGPRPAEVIDRIRELGCQGLLGNTDELLWRPEEQARQRDRAPALTMLLRWLFESYAPDTSERLGEARLAWLRERPTELWIDAIAVVHAAPRRPVASADARRSRSGVRGGVRTAAGRRSCLRTYPSSFHRDSDRDGDRQGPS